MTEYSLEPPRTHLVLHLTFDDLSGGDEPLDLSPQAKDAVSLTSGFETVPGRVGVGLEATESDSEMGPVTIGDQDEFSIAFWVRPTWLGRDPNVNEYTRVIESTNESDFIVLEEDGTITFRVPGVDTTSFQSNTAVGEEEWVHVECVYDGTDRIIYIDGDEDARGQVSSPDTTATLGDLSFLTRYPEGVALDDVRIYRRAHGPDLVSDTYDIGATHQQVDNIGDAWDNNGIPYLRGAPNANLAGTLGEVHDANFRDLDRILGAIHIDSASGLDLERIGAGHGIPRNTGETDAHYRARIKATLAAGRSRGTFDDLLEATSVVVGADPQAIRDDTENNPGTALIDINSADLSTAELTAAEIEDILRDAVPGGHDITVREVGDEPFTLIADGDSNDIALGLTDDSISTGGTLVADV